jgi:retinol dehydrogenase 14
MAGRTVLVTGGSGGIGRATAVGLARLGAHLVITGRERERSEGAAHEIRAAGGGQVDVFVADLSSRSEVRRLADAVLRSLSRIDVLVNNAGGYWNTRHVTADGLERAFALNHLAPFLLTNLLLDRLKQSAPARVVTVSSSAHRTGRIDFTDLQGARSYSGGRAYSQSKLANVLFTYELARRLQATSVTANTLHPGVVRTSFGAEDPSGVQRVFTPLVRPFMKAPAQGAATSIHLASAPDLEQVTGLYFADSKLLRGCYDTTLAGERRSGRADCRLKQPRRLRRDSDAGPPSIQIRSAQGPEVHSAGQRGSLRDCDRDPRTAHAQDVHRRLRAASAMEGGIAASRGRVRQNQMIAVIQGAANPTGSSQTHHGSETRMREEYAANALRNGPRWFQAP